jgi:hypothetical protein
MKTLDFFEMSGTPHSVTQCHVQEGLNPQFYTSQCSLRIVLMGEIFGKDRFLLYQDSVFGQVLLYLIVFSFPYFAHS